MAGPDAEWRDPAGHDKARIASGDDINTREPTRIGKARFGLSRRAVAGRGMARRGRTVRGKASRARRVTPTWPTEHDTAGQVEARRGGAELDRTWPGMARQGKARSANSDDIKVRARITARRDEAGPVRAWRGKDRRDKARQGARTTMASKFVHELRHAEVRLGSAGYGVAPRGGARQGKGPNGQTEPMVNRGSTPRRSSKGERNGSR